MKNLCLALCIAAIVHANQAFGSESGMPQLNPKYWISQIFWLVAIFATLYLILSKLILPRISAGLETRKSKILNDLDEAKQFKIESEKKIKERHRHRYEVNIKYKKEFEKKGLIFSALSPDGLLPEIIELKNHPWFVGVQFHPEFKSRPFTPHPLFSSFIKAVGSNRRKN